MANGRENKTERHEVGLTMSQEKRMVDARFEGRYNSNAEFIRTAIEQLCDKVLGPVTEGDE